MEDLKKELLQKLADSVLEMEEEKVVEYAEEFLEHGFNPLEAIELGLAKGMNRAGELYEEEEYYIPELLLCSEAMYAGIDTIRPHLPKQEQNNRSKIVIGVVQGDTHDIGKNLVKLMLETSGFDVIDLGRDVPLGDFVSKAKAEKANLIALSTLMTTTMSEMKEVVEQLEQEGLRDKIKVMIGGGPVSQHFANTIGADGYSANATEAVKLAKDLVGLTS